MKHKNGIERQRNNFIDIKATKMCFEEILIQRLERQKEEGLNTEKEIAHTHKQNS